MKRALWGAAGALALGAGLLGVILPLLPTVPFILLAAFCFSRSSERWHHWLLTHPRLGPSIRNWQTNRTISRSAKWKATCSMVIVFGISVAWGLATPIIVFQALILACVAIMLWTRPEA
ncbi:YbaN family protein [Falsirhodobacter sp. alg1]|uniref:YbaN family protein n=1 Tax=Falsirhodobacter sp. alg1 TaxID=1472418 RepID=UPI0005F09A62|nr:YbaN family protein [Falsirhodobacter sp. alg1]